MGAERRRWAVGVGLAVALHAALLAGSLLGTPPPPPEPPPAAMMVDLGPPAPATPTPTPAPLPEPTPAPAKPVPKPSPPEARPAPPTPPRIVARVTPSPPTDVAVPLPAAEAPVPARAEAPARETPAAPPTPPTPPAAAKAEAAAPSPPTKAAPTWQGQVLGRLLRFKRYPQQAQMQKQQGVAYLRFTLDRSGRVLSASIDRSSGFPLLDEETLALVRRAQPFPKPPAELGGERLELVAPVEYFIRGARP